MSETDSAPRYVLVVEDEPMIRMNAVDILEEAGNADAALRLLEARAHEIAALFTDIPMPGSMDGMALVALVAERWPDIRPFVTSGHTTFRDADIPDHGCFLAKPYRSAQLTAIVGKAFG
ncbi:response regulator [Microvirga lotononidis]|nr:response regulator [Microvirga lotononidis]WQO31368.1 response regulator [Microvirga lotononidis]